MFLRPDALVTQTFEYLLGLLAQEYGIEVHAYVAMSNHYHLVITDVEGRLPDFQRDLNSMLARSVNHYYGRWESFWDRRSYNAVELVGDEDVVARIGYTLANPVAAGLVASACDWEGASSAGVEFGQPRTIARPAKFFKERMPATATLELTRPACRDSPTWADLEERLGDDLLRRELAARTRKEPMGMEQVLARDRESRPKGYQPRRQLQPTVAAKNAEARLAALQRAAAWFDEYAEARKTFVAGDRDVEFPEGTWHMRVRLGCNCASR